MKGQSFKLTGHAVTVLLVTLVCLLGGIIIPPNAGAATSGVANPHGMGALAPTVRVNATAPHGKTGVSGALPDSVDLTAYASPVGDQGQVGSCVAWAIGYDMMGWYANTQRRTGTPYAPMYLYSQIVVGNDGGSYPSAAYNVLTTQGIAPQSVYFQGNYNWKTKPTAAERSEAEGYKATGGWRLFAGAYQGEAGKTAIKAALATGHPVALSIYVYNSFFYLNSSHSVMKYSMATGKLAGSHEILALGYNATGVVIQNSWGTAWGNKGYATLAWDFVGALVSEATYNNGFAALPAPAVTTVTPAVLPTTGGRVTITGNGFATRDLSATVGASGAPAVVVSASTHQATLNVPATAAGVSSLTIANATGRTSVGLSFGSCFAVVNRPLGGAVVIAGPLTITNGRRSVVEYGSLSVIGTGGCYAGPSVAPAISWTEISPGAPAVLNLTVNGVPGIQPWPSGASMPLGNVVVYGPGVINISPRPLGNTVYGDPSLIVPVSQNSLTLDARYASRVGLASARNRNVVTLTATAARYDMSGRYVGWASALLMIQRWSPSARAWVNVTRVLTGPTGTAKVKITSPSKLTWRVVTADSPTVWGGSTASTVR